MSLLWNKMNQEHTGGKVQKMTLTLKVFLRKSWAPARFS